MKDTRGGEVSKLLCFQMDNERIRQLKHVSERIEANLEFINMTL